MESPWLFFKDVYIISLKTEMERRKNFTKLLEERDCTNYKIINAVNGKKHPTLKQYFIKTGVINEDINISPGGLGCLASHKLVWDMAYYSIDSTEPFWILIFEDDFSFHPLISNNLFLEYIRNMPADAKFVKFGHHMIAEGYNHYKPANKYWLNMGRMRSYGTYCYAVHSDILPSLCAFKNFKEAIDCVSFNTGFYGAVDPEIVLEVPREPQMNWILYDDPYTGNKQEYRGIVGCNPHQSATFDPCIIQQKILEYLKQQNRSAVTPRNQE